MTEGTYNDALATAVQWTQVLRDNPRPHPDALEAARQASDGLQPWGTAPGAGPVLTALRAELALAGLNALGRVLDPAETTTEDPDTPKLDALMAEEPRLFTAAPSAQPEPDVWEGWAGAGLAGSAGTVADLVEWVALDLDGAADLVAALSGELPVRADIAATSSANIARACAAGAATVRLLALTGRVGGDSGGERPVSAGAELNALGIAASREVAGREIAEALKARALELESELAALESELDSANRELEELGGRYSRQAEALKRTQADRVSETAVLRQQLTQAHQALQANHSDGRQYVVAALKALDTWAPGYDAMDLQELGAELVTVASGVLTAQQQARRDLTGLTTELAAMPGVRDYSGPLLGRVRAALTASTRDDELDDANAELERANAELARRASRIGELERTLDAAKAEATRVSRVAIDRLDRIRVLESELAPPSVTTDLRPAAGPERDSETKP
jgi:hypothetical protein